MKWQTVLTNDEKMHRKQTNTVKSKARKKKRIKIKMAHDGHLLVSSITEPQVYFAHFFFCQKAFLCSHRHLTQTFPTPYMLSF